MYTFDVIPGDKTTTYSVLASFRISDNNLVTEAKQALTSKGSVQDGNVFTIAQVGAGLDRTSGIKATVTVTPTGNGGNGVVIFELMDGDIPMNIVAVESNVTKAEVLNAYFNVINSSKATYSVKVFVMDKYDSSISLPKNLAKAITIK